MIFKKSLRWVILISLISVWHSAWAQEEDTVSNETPFRQGRWLTGLAGSISSGGSSLDTLNSGAQRNQFSLELRNGYFVKNRFLVGGVISLSRIKSEEFTSRSLETLFVGPLVRGYLTNGDQGSLFVSFAGGYAKFRDESAVLQNGNPISILIDGNGGGGLLSFGYSYVMHDRVAFDLALNYSHIWLRADISESPSGARTTEDFMVADLSFSFGFSIIFDSFFF